MDKGEEGCPGPTQGTHVQIKEKDTSARNAAETL